MIDRKEIIDIVNDYNTDNIRIGTVASHSALDVFDGAIEEGFHTHAICKKGREKTYTDYFRAQRDQNGNVVRGVVDDYVNYDNFDEVMLEKNQKSLVDNDVLFIPNRSFTSYCGIDEIENDFAVPLVGSRNMLRSEERGLEKDYYWLLEKAGMPFPEKIADPQDIDELCIVKLPHAVKKLERGFFTASSYEEYLEKSESLIKQGVITREALAEARIERYVIGPVFNFDLFYSPLEEEMNPIELLGIDWRFETSLDGHVRLPAPQQMALAEHQLTPEYTVCGHNTATLRESLLEKVFELAEMYVDASREYYDPGVIGPFCLQTCVDKDLNFYIYDVAPRVGGGTNVHMSVGHPYANTLWRKPMSTGRRVAYEVRRAIETEQLDKIVT
ncbi:formate--phosphoribosylaminoimidazolecarboxamide ligase family protein [Methanohalophilus portucalensis]|uniref:5-formaminoimidazole-4-carboxamide-1-(Beta)-D-ribofuranosyl 5'-monophosphate synthetase n=2 Tax=Methanohalophilus portucalensis TaxID=39664 RepID=A0A1L9C4F9_9EURY|nr:formate--phosphoribosylaminoimidazolecarboxamide ligase family protein [Methanohalophilus portucalensis]ATU07817.1 5-formaminoimidazole-4-carboxamide-1-(beta)-D-ribofuranosyl 5'-monophosphate synthetase [Methanohalophilus portucalensis]OJH49361.1 IMP biosynthesis enzyme PurP domain protein [Methanohalophilus portucalensis FDF-1]RNI11529.1 formate--phosphoribosylaminoimidazolecarboxamide ligase family protein [Methanohalophilus portucalensis FDF-1]SMH41531.1 5-formaminoimidazole-4-carboxamide